MATWSTGFVRPGSVVVQEVVVSGAKTSSQYTTLFIGSGAKYKQYQRTDGSYGALITREDTSGLSAGEDIFYSSEVLSANVVSVIYDANGNKYTKDIDFTVTTADSNAVIQWVPISGGAYLNAPADGITYVVNFSVLKDPIKDYKAKQFFSLQSAVLWSGSKGYTDDVSNGEVNGSHLINGVTWGAEMADNNAGGAWYTIELSPYDEDTLLDPVPALVDGTLITDVDFLTKLEDIFKTEANLKKSFQQALKKSLAISVWSVIPCFPITTTPSGSAQYTAVNSTLLTTLTGHINTARGLTYQKFRVALLGAPAGADEGVIDPTLLYTDAAASILNNAICYVAPSTPTYAFGGESKDVDGSMLAAAISGVLSNPSNGPQVTLSGQAISGFDSVPAVFNPQMVTVMGNAGVMIVDSETNGSPAIVMDLTTNTATSVDEQLKFRRVTDSISNNLNAIFKRTVVNHANPGGMMTTTAKTNASLILDAYVSMGAIDSYTIAVIKNSIDTRQLDVTIPIYLTPDVLWVYTTIQENLG